MNARGDALINYVIKEKNGCKRWVKRTKLVNYGAMLAEISIVSRMIRSMIEVRKLRTPTIQLYYPNENVTCKEIEKFSVNTEEISAILTTIELDLLYFKAEEKAKDE